MMSSVTMARDWLLPLLLEGSRAHHGRQTAHDDDYTETHVNRHHLGVPGWYQLTPIWCSGSRRANLNCQKSHTQILCSGRGFCADPTGDIVNYLRCFFAAFDALIPATPLVDGCAAIYGG